MHFLSIEQKAYRTHLFSLAITKRIHQLLQLCRFLYLEKDLVVAVGNFDVEVLRWRLRCRRGRWHSRGL
jgi:hypothetical protein